MLDFVTPRPAVDTDFVPAALPARVPAGTSRPSRPGPDPEAGPGQPGYLAETERIGDEIARHAAHVHAATYRMLVLIRQFDERDGWTGGFMSCAHWLNWRIGLGLGAAREHVRVARALGSLPRISQAMERGVLSYSKVRAITRVATPDNEQELMDFALSGTASHVERLVRAWRSVDRAEEADAERICHERRFLELWPDTDGSWALRGRLDPEMGALLKAALDAAAKGLYRASRDATVEQRRADAIGLLAERALAALGPAGSADADGPAGTPGTPQRPVGRAERYQVVLHVEAEALRDGSESGQAVLEASGHRVPAETARRIACDSGAVVMTHDAGGRVLDVGRRRRTVPPAIRRALEHRDRGCRFPGCGLRYVDSHHVRHWADGGKTRLDNLLSLCRHHHRAVHEGAFRVELSQDGEVHFYRPDGRPLPVAPAAPPAPEDPVAAFEAAHTAKGIEIDPETPTPDWHGERLDMDWAISVLWRPHKEPDEQTPERGSIHMDRAKSSSRRCVTPLSPGGIGRRRPRRSSCG